jgi:hypothetical protein
MALLTTQVVTRAAITPTYGAVAASDTFVPGDTTFLHIKNGGGSPDAVSVAAPGSAVLPNVTNAATTVSVTNAQERMIGPFPANVYADPTTGLVTVTHSFTTSVTVAVINVQRP